MRRAYTHVAVVPAEDAHTIACDGRPASTPAGKPLALPSAALARAIAQEWDGQSDTVRFATMPLTRIANTALDRVAPDPAAVVHDLLAFAGTDLLCHRADKAVDAELAAAQERLWQPPLDWLAARFAVRLKIVRGLLPSTPEAATAAALRTALVAEGAFRLAAIDLACRASGSCVLALALAHGQLDADQAARLSQLDETHQAARWGEDEEAQTSRRARHQDVANAARFLELLGPDAHLA